MAFFSPIKQDVVEIVQEYSLILIAANICPILETN